MKKMILCAAGAIMALLLSSCGDSEAYKGFVGTWGVEKIEYYNIDYAGNPISGTVETYDYDADDIGHGIQLVFKEDKKGEMRDNDIDSLPVIQGNDTVYIQCPDTTLVTTFTYSYDAGDKILYMNMSYMRTFKMHILDLTDNSMIYENEYDKNYMEKATLKRLSKTPTKSGSRKSAARPHKHGSLLGDR